MDIMDEYHTQMKVAELALALKFPVYEAEYQLEKDDNPLKLYDSFIPRLKSHLVSKPAYKEKHTEMQEKLKREQNNVFKEKIEWLRKENEKL